MATPFNKLEIEMKNLKISYQKATAISRKEGLEGLPKKGESRLLKTGAKLANWDSEYWICGYAWDGSDIELYR